MKNVVMMLVSVVLGVLTLAVVMTVCGSMNRRVEVQSNLPSAMEMTVEQKTGMQELDWCGAIAQWMENMAAAIDSDSGLTVDVYQADVEKGVLAIRILERFRHPNGESGEALCERAVVYNRVEETEPEIYEVSFYVSRAQMLGKEKCYKSYAIQGGGYVKAPVIPAVQGTAFAGWRDRNDYLADFSQPVQQNLVYYAEWE